MYIYKYTYINICIYHVIHQLNSADISIISLKISKFCFTKKYR